MVFNATCASVKPGKLRDAHWENIGKMGRYCDPACLKIESAAIPERVSVTIEAGLQLRYDEKVQESRGDCSAYTAKGHFCRSCSHQPATLLPKQ